MSILGAQPVIAAILSAVLLGGDRGRSAPQAPTVRSVDERVLRGYAGVYQWEPNAFLYIQMWSEFTGKNQLVAFDESGEVRTLYPIADDRLLRGPALPFQRRLNPEFHPPKRLWAAARSNPADRRTHETPVRIRADRARVG